MTFGLYNLFFIAGNWAYIQRYTSVATPGDAKKVGWLFGGLYSISPLIWMLPPMIYKVLNPELGGLADEGAYLLMCKEVLPIGMLGLMLGGMIFATSSSVNTTLNISAGVLSNDVYKHFFPETSGDDLVKVGRLATIGLGLITIVVALLVPYMGGIVEVVMSLAAITGGAMFLPPLVALFSKYQTGKSVLAVTIVSLVLNSFFKFVMPQMFGFSLDRAMEMTAGVGIPMVLLIIIEMYFRMGASDTSQYDAYLEKVNAKVSQEAEKSKQGNKKGGRVIGIGVGSTGLLIVIISMLEGNPTALVTGMGVLVLLLGGYIIYKNSKKELNVS